MSKKPNKQTAVKVLEILSHGLTRGLGVPSPGKMCVEAAVCFAMGLPHSDQPPCVGESVREFKIRLNDCEWSSDQSRADGMRSLAVAQLGSDILSQDDFGRRMYLRSTQVLLPWVFRKVANDPKTKPKHSEEYLHHAKSCEHVATFDDARSATKSASASASASAYAYASASASASAYAYAYDYDYAYAYAWFRKNCGDELLRLTAQVGVDVLIEMKSPGCEWLYLCDESK